MIEWFEKAIDFSNILNISITASWLILVVIGLRLILKKAPKWVNVALWGIVALRLLMPFSIESSLSLVPSAETVSDQLLQAEPEYSHGDAQLDIITNPTYGSFVTMELDDSMDSVQWSMVKMSLIWYAGIAAMSAYTLISFFILRRKLRTAVILRDNLFQCETVSSPFVLGILKPKIYLPYGMDDQNLSHVIAHEQAHIRRKDHWWKPLGFLLLTIHWFNPLMWAAYILLCRDIELACDEKVIAELGNEQRADYTQALVACAVNRRMIAACPLAFGEVGVKERVKSVMNYKKPAFWIIVTALVVCVVVSVCFLTDPNPSRKFSMKGQNVSRLEPEAIVDRIVDIEDWEYSSIYMNSNNFSLMVDSNFNWVDSQAVRYFFSNAHSTYSAQLRIFPDEDKYFLTEPSEWVEQNRIFLLQHYLEALKYLPQDAIRQLAPADQYIIQHREEGTPKSYDRVITYTPYGAKEINSWYIHLEILPQHKDGEGFHGTGDEAIHVFYGDDDASRGILTLNDVILLSQKGYDLTWEDFENYDYIETGSGLYIRVYKINDMFELWIGGGGPDSEPMYIYLTLGDDLDTRIDIRDSGVTEFIQAHNKGIQNSSDTVMVPTDTKLQGLHAGALLLPIDGNTYRYLLTDNTGEGVTADELIFEFKEPDLNRTIDWKVYSLKEHPDLSVVMILSKEEGPWLCTYSPPGRCSDTALSDAINAGYVVMEDGVATHGQDVWKTFYEDTQKGNAASVIVAHYQTLDPERCDTAYFEAFNQDYPYLNLYHLTFDGTTYTLSFTDGGVEYTRTFEYLMKYEASGTPLVGNTEHKRIVHYALTHDTKHTWEELWGSIASSVFPAAIDFYPIYAERVN